MKSILITNLLTSNEFYAIKNKAMEKKEVFDHLSRIYLGPSQETTVPPKEHTKIPQHIFLISTLFIAIITGASWFFFGRNRGVNSETVLVLCPDVVKINFHFAPAKKEMYSLDLNGLNLNRFKVLGFFLKKSNYADTVALRIEFTNAFREKSEFYLNDIPHKWQSYRIGLAEFKHISDWSKMSGLSFIVEEWNTKEKKGVVYIDNVRFLS